MTDEKLAPDDAKVISAIIRSLGIDECEPKVIAQLLEFAYKYTCDVLVDAQDYAIYCERQTITSKDVKLAIQTRIANKCVAVPSKKLLQYAADEVNKNPLTYPDSENLIRAPNAKSGFYGIDYDYFDPTASNRDSRSQEVEES